MESLKRLAEICMPDERQLRFVTFTGEAPGDFRQRTIDDIHKSAEGIVLHEGVPEKVRSHFSTALNLLLYSWFHYPFNVTAQFMAYVSVELALKEKFQPKKQTSFKKLIKQAVEKGFVSASGFSHLDQEKINHPYLGVEFQSVDASQYCSDLIDAMPYLRNQLAHGSNMLHPNGTQSVRICAEFINQIFQKNG